MQIVSVAKIKSHLSEFLTRSAFNNEKFIISRRNKPIAALVSIDDLRKIEQFDERKGLAELSGKWNGFDEVSAFLDDIESLRMDKGDRKLPTMD